MDVRVRAAVPVTGPSPCKLALAQRAVMHGGLHTAWLGPAHVSHRTPRGRNWMLMRGPVTRALFGMACSHVR